jgi:hypothetical protein
MDLEQVAHVVSTVSGAKELEYVLVDRYAHKQIIRLQLQACKSCWVSFWG